MENYDLVLKDYLWFNSLNADDKKAILAEYKNIQSEETPPLALKRRGTTPPPNWKEILIKQNEKRERFNKEHPSFRCEGIAHELQTVLASKRAVLVNTLRKGRESINNVNVLASDEYFIVVYNRLINSSQTSVVFSGIPLKAIDEIECFNFLKPYVPAKKHNFTIETVHTKPLGEYLGISEFTFSRLVINENS